MTEEKKAEIILTEAAVDGASAFLSLICLPAAEEFGLLLKDKVSGWCANNAVKIANKAQLLLEKQTGNLVTSAHPRIIYSTIENGSWAENDLMQNFWAGLLASSCTSDGKDESNLIFNKYSFEDYNQLSMANRIEPFLAINFEPLFQRKITYSALISVDSFLLLA